VIQALFISRLEAATNPISRRRQHNQRVRQPCPCGCGRQPEFSLSLSAQSVTVAPGGSANLMISASAAGGFNGPISLSCSARWSDLCFQSFDDLSRVEHVTSTLTISAASTPPVTGYGAMGVAVLLPGLGLFGTVLTTRKRKPLTRKSILSMRILGLLLLTVLIVRRRMR
jgi:hypothetical protein